MKNKTLLFIGATAMLLAACKGNSQYQKSETSDSTFVATIDNSKSAGTANADAVLPSKLIKTASIDFKVKDAQKTGDDIAMLVKSYGGVVMHHHLNSVVENSKQIPLNNDSVMHISAVQTIADLEVKVPAANLEDFMISISKMGVYIADRKMDIDDRTLSYLATELKLKNRQEFVAGENKGKIKVKSPDSALALKDDMVDRRISNLSTNDAVRYSVVNLHLVQSNKITKEILLNDDPGSYNASFFSRTKQALLNGWNILEDILFGILNVWFLIVAGGLIWLCYIYYKKRPRKIQPQI